MDDFPAGPTSPGPLRPPLSVVIPVHNGGRNFERCLQRLRDSSWTDFELVVVDDGSTDGSSDLARTFGARVVRHEQPKGPAAARNAGAEAATAPIVFFLDADVALHRDALARALEHLAAQPDVAALFGSYDDNPAAPGLVSQYRNLLHHYIHQRGSFANGSRPVHTFWTGCGAIRRQVFLDLGGFDPLLYRRPAIEDIELGYRITRAGLRIDLVRDLQATHLKKWSLAEVIRTDIFQRGVPWMLLLRRSRVPETDLNVSPSQRVCVAVTGLSGFALMAAPWYLWLLLLPLIALATIIGINRSFYRFLASRRGWAFAIASIPLHIIYYGCCGLSVVIALGISLLSAREAEMAPERLPTGHRLDSAESSQPQPLKTRSRRPLPWTRP
ncbi:MAG TPA: glycosyltransferase family A protein [Isosphaeraceae bacterium]|nr:glycosyltransferase family A protein [Isosphaeraceae bacterium]